MNFLRQIYTCLSRGIAAGVVWFIGPRTTRAENTGSGDNTDGGAQVSIQNPLPEDVDTISGLLELIIKNIILPIGSILVVVMIIFTGFKFVVARGNEEKLREAKSALTWTVVGAAVLLGSWVIAEAIQATLCNIAESTC